MTTTVTAEAPTTEVVRSPRHRSTYSLGVALRRLSDELLEAPNREIAETVLSVYYQVAVRPDVSDEVRRAAVDVIASLTMPGTAVEFGLTGYATAGVTRARSDMWTHAYAPVDDGAKVPTTVPAEWTDVETGQVAR